MAPPEDADADSRLIARIAAARPAGDPLARSVLFAQLSAALFSEGVPVLVGRYRLARRLGRGGGGTVFAAEDPELRREVAVKLIPCASAAQRERALAEARALARLSHPHVVPVHDVGESGERVYLVMERLSGESLRAFTQREGRPARQLLEAFHQAALGLAAAHGAGLAHRDFKPENALFGADGRLKVVDFGLARGTDEAAAAPEGTPRYMAPEQREAGPSGSGPAVDQYALGVCLLEGFAAAARPAPAWVRKVAARLTAQAPADRFPSMEEAARALDPLRRWRRRAWALLAVPALVAAAGFALGQRVTDAREACAGGEQTLSAAWSAPRVEALAAKLKAGGTPLALALAPQLRQRALEAGRGWLWAHRDSCERHARGELSPELFDKAAACLSRVRAGLGEALTALEQASPEQLDAAASALAQVPGAAGCADPAQLVEQPPAPRGAQELAADEATEAAAVQARAGSARAQPLAQAAVALARQTGEPKLLARALLTLGHARLKDDRAGAVAPLQESYLLALSSGQDALAAEAWARWAWARGRTAPAEALRPLDGLEVMRALAERAGAKGAFARALLVNNAASLALTAGELERARADFATAVELARGVSGPGAIELVTATSNLATVTVERAERTRLFERAVRALAERVGPSHWQTVEKEMLAAFDGDQPREVLARLEELCPRLSALHPSQRGAIERCALELGWQAFALGDLGAVRAASGLVDAPAAQAPEPAWLLATWAELAQGRAAPDRLAALAAVPRPAPESVARSAWYQHLYASDAELLLAQLAFSSGRREQAHAAAERARRHLTRALEQTGAPYGVLLRRKAWVQALP